MKQSINPTVFFAVIAVLVVLAGVLAFWVWNRPSTTAAVAGENGAMSTREANGANARADHGGPTPEQVQEIQEWKKTHPGATTKH